MGYMVLYSRRQLLMNNPDFGCDWETKVTVEYGNIKMYA
jgi:hypothetical protein